ncbi:reverse transcriptase domain-containing protein [Tanacetum coccineum]
MASIRAIILSVLELLLPSSEKATTMIEDFDNVAFGQIVTMTVSEHFLHTKPSVDSEEFVNVFMRIGFGSTIELVSFDKGQVVTFDSKFVCGFRNSDCETRVRSGSSNGSTSSDLEARGTTMGRVKQLKIIETHTSPRSRCKKATKAIELGEHNIKFKGCNSVKEQILANFLAETPSIKDKDTSTNKPATTNEVPNPKSIWEFYNNGASSPNDSGAGLILVSPERKEYTYALRFEFETTNNKAEYEALLADLQIATYMKIKYMAIFVDSHLVANQVKGLFEARRAVIKQYLEKTEEVLESFDSFTIEHARRE